MYEIIIRYSLVFTILLFSSGVWLFVINQTDTIDAKSLERILEVAVPHLLSMSVLVFVLTHFLLFIEDLDKQKALKFSMILYFVIVIENLSSSFVYIQATALFIMGISFAWLGYRLSTCTKVSKFP